MNTIRVCAFGPLTEIIGEVPIELGVELSVSAADLQSELLRRFPGLGERQYRLAVDERFVEGEERVGGGSEVALLPPFGGG
ncbi:MAG: MoaD/ThiS family protein [Spirochaetota bacterium]